MKQGSSIRGEIIIVGLGGGGVLVTGQTLAWAAALRYKYATWVPFYAMAKRGGLSECTVVFSDQEIASPLLKQAKTLILLDSSQAHSLEERVRPGGLMILERESLAEPVEGANIQTLVVPAIEMAIKLGSIQGANFIMAGAYVATTKAIEVELVEKEINRRYAANEKALSSNMEAFRKGLEFV